MPDLHGWISEKVAEVEARARAASAWGAVWYHDDFVNEIRDDGNGNTIAAVYLPEYAAHIVDQAPAAVLRRCAGDRKILEIHNYHGGSYDVLACTGCGYDDMGYLVDHVNDCETLQAIADGYGITDVELAQLDRPQQPSRQETSARPQWDAWLMGTLRCLTTPTTAVPAALRGPNWKAKP